MSKFTSKASKKSTTRKTSSGVTHTPSFTSEQVTNYMSGTSYTLDPIATLRMILASSIFGEPSYYQTKEQRTEISLSAINAALDYDFDATLKVAVELRKSAWMRLNPQIIFVLAAQHKNRQEWTAKNPGMFSSLLEQVAWRPDDITTQLEFYIALHGTKNHLPNILKRAMTDRMSKFEKYHIAKYKNTGIGLVDVCRMLNTRYLRMNNSAINELLEKGTIEVSETETTARALKSAGKTWHEIINSGVRVTHDDYLHNLRGMLSELNSTATLDAKGVCNRFVETAKNSKIWPYKYWIAYKQLQSDTFNHKRLALEALEDALNIVVKNDHLDGRVDVLSDNSGSARGATTIENGNAGVYEIGNLSGVITALAAGDGHLFVFGDSLIEVPLSSRDSVMTQAQKANDLGNRVGQNTENGVWLYFDKIIREKIHVDTVFIYSDMQAGHGGLYGVNPREYQEYTWKNTCNIDVWKLIETYRKTVNAKLNVFCIQTAGYTNSVMPENKYRGANLSGWTGKEAAYAREVINIWNTEEGKQ